LEGFLPFSRAAAHRAAPFWQQETAWRREPLYEGFPPGSNMSEFQPSISARRFEDCLGVPHRRGSVTMLKDAETP
jgi:hypothetical protein